MARTPFIAELCIFPFNFVPKGWAECNGQILPRAQNTALFSLLNTTYGGSDTTFALPDLRAAIPVHPDQGPGLSEYFLGEQGGSSSVTLLESEIPQHLHSAFANAAQADLQSPSPDRVLARSSGGSAYHTTTTGLQSLAPQALAPAGGDVPHNNLMPYLCLRICIALQGIFPPRP